MLNKIRYYSLPILSGFLIGTSYIPFPPWALFFCIVPLWIFWKSENSYRKIFLGGWLTQFVLNGIGFHWIAYTTVEFGRMPWPAGIAVLLLFCIFAHLYYPVAGVLWKFISKKLQMSSMASMLLLPFVFILCERVYPFIFYWHFGYPWLWARLPGFQLAEWIGFFGLNLISLIINALLALFWLNRRKGQWVHPYSIAAVSLLLIVNLLGVVQSQIIPPPDKNFRVLVVQGNIGNLEKVQAQKGGQFVNHIVNRYLELTQKALENQKPVDAIIWPETAFPETIYENRLGYEGLKLARFTNDNNVILITGAYQRLGEKRKIYNGLAVLQGENLLDSYQKTHLLAFGEYFPFGETFPQLRAMFPMVSDFGRGPGPSLLNFPGVKIGAQICYEGLFDEFSTELQNKDAQIFINVTNDSWFGYPFETYQHMYMTLARAIENRRPLIRSTNTGISTAILHDGTVLEHSPRDKEWAKIYDIPFHSTPPNTFYVNLSRKWPLILLIIIGLIIAGDRFARTRKH